MTTPHFTGVLIHSFSLSMLTYTFIYKQSCFSFFVAGMSAFKLDPFQSPHLL